MGQAGGVATGKVSCGAAAKDFNRNLSALDVDCAEQRCKEQCGPDKRDKYLVTDQAMCFVPGFEAAEEPVPIHAHAPPPEGKPPMPTRPRAVHGHDRYQSMVFAKEEPAAPVAAQEEDPAAAEPPVPLAEDTASGEHPAAAQPQPAVELLKSVADEVSIANRLDIEFQLPDDSRQLVFFVQRPIGVEFTRSRSHPMKVTRTHGHGEKLGVRPGWLVAGINGEAVQNKDFDYAFYLVRKTVLQLPGGEEADESLPAEFILHAVPCAGDMGYSRTSSIFLPGRFEGPGPLVAMSVDKGFLQPGSDLGFGPSATVAGAVSPFVSKAFLQPLPERGMELSDAAMGDCLLPMGEGPLSAPVGPDGYVVQPPRAATRQLHPLPESGREAGMRSAVPPSIRAQPLPARFDPHPYLARMDDPRPVEEDKAIEQLGVVGFWHGNGCDESWDVMCKSGFLGTGFDQGSERLAVEAPSFPGWPVRFRSAETAFQTLKFWKHAGELAGLSGAEAREVCKLHRRGSDLSYAGFGSAWTGMRRILQAKFAPGSKFGEGLLRTDDAILLNHGPDAGGDKVWSDGGDGEGANWLGMQLMLIRDELSGKRRWTDCIKRMFDTNSGSPNDFQAALRWQQAIRAARLAIHHAEGKDDIRQRGLLSPKGFKSSLQAMRTEEVVHLTSASAEAAPLPSPWLPPPPELEPSLPPARMHLSAPAAAPAAVPQAAPRPMPGRGTVAAVAAALAAVADAAPPPPPPAKPAPSPARTASRVSAAVPEPQEPQDRPSAKKYPPLEASVAVPEPAAKAKGKAKGKSKDKATPKAKAIPKPIEIPAQDSSEEIILDATEASVVLKKKPGQRLGIEFEAVEEGMMIEKVTGGIIGEHNDGRSKVKISSGDLIVEVNGVRGAGHNLVAEIKQSEVLRFKVLKLGGK